MDRLAIHEALKEVWRQVPDVRCKGLCSAACGPILCSLAEWRQIRERGPIRQRADTLTCPILVDGRCSRYDIRPLICRLYGAVKKMRCPHGCKPGRWLSDIEAYRLMAEVDRLSGGEIDGPANHHNLRWFHQSLK